MQAHSQDVEPTMMAIGGTQQSARPALGLGVAVLVPDLRWEIKRRAHESGLSAQGRSPFRCKHSSSNLHLRVAAIGSRIPSCSGEGGLAGVTSQLPPGAASPSERWLRRGIWWQGKKTEEIAECEVR